MKNSTESKNESKERNPINRKLSALDRVVSGIRGSSCDQEREEKLAVLHGKKTACMLDGFRKPCFPKRYSELPDDDMELLQNVLDAKMHGNRSRTEIKFLKLFGQWRGDVLFCEVVSKGNIEILLRASMHCRKGGDEDSAYRILSFVCTEYGFHMSDPPSTNEEVYRLSDSYCRDSSAISDELLYEDKKGGKRNVKVAAQLDWEGILDGIE